MIYLYIHRYIHAYIYIYIYIYFFSENSQTLDNTDLLDPEKCNEFVNDRDICRENNDMDKK